MSDHYSQVFFFCINHIIAPLCTATPTGNLLTKTSAIGWTSFAYNYTALSARPTLVFGFTTSTWNYIYLDSVSVVDNSAPAIQLLNNPGFDNSTTNLTGWITWCTSACGAGFPGRVLTNGSCHSGSCYYDHCLTSGCDYIVQSFPATIGHVYTISFWAEVVVAFSTVRFTANVMN